MTLDKQLIGGYLHPHEQSIPIHHTAYQQKPSLQAWQIFARWVYRFSQTTPIGPWLVPAKRLHRSWPFLANAQSPIYYQRHHSGNFLRYHQYKSHPANLVPLSAIPSKFYPVRHPTKHDTIARFPSPKTTKLLPSWMLRHTPSEWHQRLLENVEYIQDHDYATCVNLHLATDGSVIEQHGTYGWTLRDDDNHECAQCIGRIFEPADSLRAEAYAMASALLYLRCISDQFASFSTVSIRHYLDSKSLQDILARENLNPLDSHWDVIHEVDLIRKSLECSLTSIHVKSHQDAHTPRQHLDKGAQLNCQADDLATLAHKLVAPSNFIPLPSASVYLHLHHQPTFCAPKSLLEHRIHARDIRDHTCNRFSWDVSTFDDVDWTMIQYLHSNAGSRLHAIKFTQGVLPVNAKVSHYSTYRDASCPFCKHPTEDQQHYLQCTHKSKLEWRQQLFKTMRELHVPHPHVRDIILLELESWWKNIPPPDHHRISDTLYTAITSQRNLGWYPFILGYVSMAWQSHWDVEHSFTARSTVRKILLSIWRAEQNLWEKKKFMSTPHSRFSTSYFKPSRTPKTHSRYVSISRRH